MRPFNNYVLSLEGDNTVENVAKVEKPLIPVFAQKQPRGEEYGDRVWYLKDPTTGRMKQITKQKISLTSW
jgi:hypothetical protein